MLKKIFLFIFCMGMMAGSSSAWILMQETEDALKKGKKTNLEKVIDGETIYYAACVDEDVVDGEAQKKFSEKASALFSFAWDSWRLKALEYLDRRLDKDEFEDVIAALEQPLELEEVPCPSSNKRVKTRSKAPKPDVIFLDGKKKVGDLTFFYMGAYSPLDKTMVIKFNDVEVERIITHEFGHWLGFSDLYHGGAKEWLHEDNGTLPNVSFKYGSSWPMDSMMSTAHEVGCRDVDGLINLIDLIKHYSRGESSGWQSMCEDGAYYKNGFMLDRPPLFIQIEKKLYITYYTRTGAIKRKKIFDLFDEPVRSDLPEYIPLFTSWKYNQKGEISSATDQQGREWQLFYQGDRVYGIIEDLAGHLEDYFQIIYKGISGETQASSHVYKRLKNGHDNLASMIENAEGMPKSFIQESLLKTSGEIHRLNEQWQFGPGQTNGNELFYSAPGKEQGVATIYWNVMQNENGDKVVEQRISFAEEYSSSCRYPVYLSWKISQQGEQSAWEPDESKEEIQFKDAEGKPYLFSLAVAELFFLFPDKVSDGFINERVMEYDRETESLRREETAKCAKIEFELLEKMGLLGKIPWQGMDGHIGYPLLMSPSQFEHLVNRAKKTQEERIRLAQKEGYMSLEKYWARPPYWWISEHANEWYNLWQIKSQALARGFWAEDPRLQTLFEQIEKNFATICSHKGVIEGEKNWEEMRKKDYSLGELVHFLEAENVSLQKQVEALGPLERDSSTAMMSHAAYKRYQKEQEQKQAEEYFSNKIFSPVSVKTDKKRTKQEQGSLAKQPDRIDNLSDLLDRQPFNY